jgi:prolyl-tRNA editing enzyme YbaK/EbsC (Cys-tRNA(Pro) deacylase)
VLANERIAFNAGSLTESVIMSTEDWREIARPVSIVDVAEHA